MPSPLHGCLLFLLPALRPSVGRSEELGADLEVGHPVSGAADARQTAPSCEWKFPVRRPKRSFSTLPFRMFLTGLPRTTGTGKLSGRIATFGWAVIPMSVAGAARGPDPVANRKRCRGSAGRAGARRTVPGSTEIRNRSTFGQRRPLTLRSHCTCRCARGKFARRSGSFRRRLVIGPGPATSTARRWRWAARASRRSSSADMETPSGHWRARSPWRERMPIFAGGFCTFWRGCFSTSMGASGPRTLPRRSLPTGARYQ